MARSTVSRPGADVPVTADAPTPAPDVDEQPGTPAGGDVQALGDVDEAAAAADSAAAGDEPAPDDAAAALEVDEDTESAEQARQRVREAEEALARAVEQAGAQLPGGGYVIATERLYVPGGARAHNPGDRVPVGNVERNGWVGLVRAPAPGE